MPNGLNMGEAAASAATKAFGNPAIWNASGLRPDGKLLFRILYDQENRIFVIKRHGCCFSGSKPTLTFSMSAMFVEGTNVNEECENLGQAVSNLHRVSSISQLFIAKMIETILT